MSKEALVLALAVLLILALFGTQLISLGKANPYYRDIQDVSPPDDAETKFTIASPENNTIYASGDLLLNFNVSVKSAKWYRIDMITYKTSWKEDTFTVYKWVWSPENPDPPFVDYSFIVNLTGIQEGKQNITITVIGRGGYAIDYVAYNFYTNVSSSIYFTIDAISPIVSILTLENKSYNEAPLNFTINEPYSHLSYSLDNQKNITISGNTTFSNLSYGIHNVTVYAWDLAGNAGASETLFFDVEALEPFPALPAAAVSVAAVALVTAGLLVYYKRKSQNSSVKKH